MSDRPLIQVILGSTRPGRFSEKAGAWVIDRLGCATTWSSSYSTCVTSRCRSTSTSGRRHMGTVNTPRRSTRWAQAIERGDGYIVVSSEYNHGYPAVLKNAFDNIFPEFNRKPITFVGYGDRRRRPGDRAAAPGRRRARDGSAPPRGTHPPRADGPGDQGRGRLFDVELFASLDEKLTVVADDLLWWARALGRARAGESG